MKTQFVSALIAALFAGGAMAQTSPSTMPDKGPAVVSPPGAAQGRTPTATNSPAASSTMQQRETAKPTGVTGGGASGPKVISKPDQVQGKAKTAAQRAKKGGYEAGRKTMDKNVKAPTAPVLTTPAPGPAVTTPSAGPGGSTPTSK